PQRRKADLPASIRCCCRSVCSAPAFWPGRCSRATTTSSRDSRPRQAPAAVHPAEAAVPATAGAVRDAAPAAAADAEDAARVFETVPKLGVGLGFRPQFKSEVFLNRPKIDLLEITSDHYMDSPRRKVEELELLAEHFPLIPHSLELSLGSAEGVDQEYLAKLADVVSIARPAWFSDHICFTRSGGVKIGHLAPVPFTEEAL